MRVADVIADFIANLGIHHVFSVTGGGSAFLNDAFGHHEKIKTIYHHHEQGAAFAAEAYGRINGIGCCVVTTGPGGSNALTGLISCWTDSIPVIFISGQVPRKDQINGDAVRQMGVQEFDILRQVHGITKWSISIKDASEVPAALQTAYRMAVSRRPGPVWLDIPLDIQAAQCEWVSIYHPVQLTPYIGDGQWRDLVQLTPYIGDGQWRDLVMMMQKAQRPVLMLGNGARGGRVLDLVKQWGVPVLTSWAAADMIGGHPYGFGRPGLFGSRAANLIMQNADLIVAVGCRLAIPQIGYRTDLWARGAKVVMVDVDSCEMSKRTLHVDLKIWWDAKVFIGYSLGADMPSQPRTEWFQQCVAWEKKYPVLQPPAWVGPAPEGVDPFMFVDTLSQILPEDAIVVTDMGTAFTATFQAAKMKNGQRWISAFGLAPMGWGLPGAIGAHYATGKRIYCIVGDGGLQFNLQELATIVGNNIPITLMVLDNGGYVAINHMQDNHFKRRAGSDHRDLWFPDLRSLATLYHFAYCEVKHCHEVQDTLQYIVDRPKQRELLRIKVPADFKLTPRVGSFRLPDGSISSRPLEDMVPHLDRAELEAEMLVPLVEE